MEQTEQEKKKGGGAVKAEQRKDCVLRLDRDQAGVESLTRHDKRKGKVMVSWSDWGRGAKVCQPGVTTCP